MVDFEALRRTDWMYDRTNASVVGTLTALGLVAIRPDEDEEGNERAIEDAAEERGTTASPFCAGLFPSSRRAVDRLRSRSAEDGVTVLDVAFEAVDNEEVDEGEGGEEDDDGVS